MDSPLPPDPYNALGLAKDATSESIKKAYRKLALRLHPDKCTDESQKQANTDEFHKVQQAYDIVGDEDKRARYDAQVRLAELRRQNLELRNDGSRGSTRYDIRTAAPQSSSYATARGSTRPSAYADVRPRYYDDEPPRASARKAADYEYASTKRSSPPRDRERERESERIRERLERERERERERLRMAEREREREIEERRRAERRREEAVKEARSRKHDARDEYEEERRRRDREYEEELRKKTSEARRPPLRREDYPSASSTTYAYAPSNATGSTTQREMEEKIYEAQRHQQQQQTRNRPATSRTTSTRDVPHYDVPRRSSATVREKDRTRRTSPSKESEQKIPSLSTHASSPPVMQPTREAPPSRSYTTQTDVDPRRKAEHNSPPPPPLGRATTMPVNVQAATSSSSSSSRRKEATTQSSKLRHSQTSTPTESAYSTPVATPSEYTTKQYRYPEPTSTASTSQRTESASSGAYVSANGHVAKTVLREPGESKSRPASNTAAKMARLDPKKYPTSTARQYVYPDTTTATPSAAVRPSVSHSSSARAVPVAPTTSRSSRSPERSSRRERERERDRYVELPRTTKPLYGERTQYAPRPQPTSYAPENISFTKRYDEDDVIYSSPGSRNRTRGDDFIRPTMGRSTTYAY